MKITYLSLVHQVALLNKVSPVSPVLASFCCLRLRFFYSLTLSTHSRFVLVSPLPLLKQPCCELVKALFLLMKCYIPCWHAAHLPHASDWFTFMSPVEAGNLSHRQHCANIILITQVICAFFSLKGLFFSLKGHFSP